MNFNQIRRIPAQLSFAFFMAISFMAFGQKSTSLANTRFNQLLTTGDAAAMRTRILSKPGATVGRKGVSETRTGTVNRKAVTVDVASQFFNTNDGEVEQISIRVNEDGRERFWVLSQINDRIVERLDGGGGFVTNAIADARECLRQELDNSAKCNECLDNLAGCAELGIAQSVLCATGQFINPVGPCSRCGLIAVFEAIDCIVGEN